jgi:hypothetical protein
MRSCIHSCRNIYLVITASPPWAKFLRNNSREIAANSDSQPGSKECHNLKTKDGLTPRVCSNWHDVHRLTNQFHPYLNVATCFSLLLTSYYLYPGYTRRFRAVVQCLRMLLGTSLGAYVNKVLQICCRFRVTTFLRWRLFYNCDFRFLRNRNSLFWHNMSADILIWMKERFCSL